MLFNIASRKFYFNEDGMQRLPSFFYRLLLISNKFDSELKIVCLCSIRNEVLEATRYNTQRYQAWKHHEKSWWKWKVSTFKVTVSCVLKQEKFCLILNLEGSWELHDLKIEGGEVVLDQRTILLGNTKPEINKRQIGLNGHLSTYTNLSRSLIFKEWIQYL